MSDFTMEGYNDKSVDCITKGCKGKIEPTWNANVGRCKTCKERFNWARVHKTKKAKK